MVHQMDRYKMHDYVHWSQIIAEAKKSMDKFINVNKAKYEDLVQFIHLTLDHIAKSNIKLDCESFAILFNTQVTSNMPPVKDLDLTPILPKPAHLVNAQLPKPKKGQKSVGRSSTSSCSHVRKLNFEIEYQLKPIEVTPIKSYRRPDKYKAIVSPFEETQPIPLEPNSPANMDPRLIHMFKRTPKPIEPRRFLGRITVHIGSGDEPEISRPAKRRRVVWDLS
ncbi:uncharacterized protein LOC107369983 isoform X2 [Tetranychus urticae]|nr:uncharacterized protein LOC107369983 isoform X2 [Tetranychus urticae]